MLYHGTRDIDPKLIYAAGGFDKKYSANMGRMAMWGPGNYFSAKSSYGNEHRYKVCDKKREF